MVEEKPLRVLIADDEPLAGERLQLLLARSDGAQLVGTASDGNSAINLTEALHPDLLLLDIAMPGLDGIGVARALATQSPSPAVVFITAFDQFAVAAFEVEAVDYLMKPVDPAASARARPGSGLPRAADGSAAAGQELAMAGGILGVRLVRSRPDRRPGRGPGLGRAGLYAAPRWSPELADPPFHGRARRRPQSGPVRPAAPFGYRSEGFHHGLYPRTSPADGSPVWRRDRTARRTSLLGPSPGHRRSLRRNNRRASEDARRFQLDAGSLGSDDQRCGTTDSDGAMPRSSNRFFKCRPRPLDRIAAANVRRCGDWICRESSNSQTTRAANVIRRSRACAPVSEPRLRSA